MLTEKPYKLIANRPQLFQTIIENDEQRRLTKSSQVVNFAEHKNLKKTHEYLMKEAELRLAGTKDKGRSI